MDGLAGAFVYGVGYPGTLGTLLICGVPCTNGAPGVYAWPLLNSISPPRAAPYRGAQGRPGVVCSSSFSLTASGGVPGPCVFGYRAVTLPGVGSLFEGGQVAGVVPLSGVHVCSSGV